VPMMLQYDRGRRCAAAAAGKQFRKACRGVREVLNMAGILKPAPLDF